LKTPVKTVFLTTSFGRPTFTDASLPTGLAARPGSSLRSRGPRVRLSASPPRPRLLEAAKRRPR
jgi:hypothetical protein